MLIWVIGLFILVPSIGQACGGSSPNLVAASSAYADVNDCYTAAVDGDTITVPAGSSTWTSKLTWTNKSISLIGAGIGSTVITSNVTGSYPCLINLTAKPTGNFPAGLTRISGFTFQAGANCGDNTPATGEGLIQIGGDTANFRFDHNRVEASNIAGGMNFTGYVRGVIDHNQMVNLDASNIRHPLSCTHSSWGNVGAYGDNSWASDSTMGSADVLTFEDNTFDRVSGTPHGVADDFTGCRSAYRFNTFTNIYLATHGTESSGRPRGFRHEEIYRNDTTWSGGAVESLIGFRGGTGYIFDNNVAVTGSPPGRYGALTTFRRDYNVSGVGQYVWGGCGAQITITSITRSGSTATVTTSGEHFIHASGSWVTIAGANESEYNGNFIGTRTSSTTFTYTVSGTPASPATGTITKSSPFDGNTDSTGYRCLDQAGSGKSILYANGSPATITPVSPGNNALEPIYCFNNKFDATPTGCQAMSATDIIIENTEFYNYTASFDGTVGVGRGLRSSRPSTCTAGVAYWSTDGGGNWNTSTTETHSDSPGDDGALDVCTATNTWTNDYYTPYTYPHPLIAQTNNSKRFSPLLHLHRTSWPIPYVNERERYEN